MIWFCWVLWHINHCRLFKAKYSLYILNIHDWFGCVLWHINQCRLFNDKSSNTYINYMWFGFGWVLWHINYYSLFNAKSFLYIYIKHVWFDLVWFYGISSIVGYLKPNHLYTYILNPYDLIWVVWHINHYKSS